MVTINRIFSYLKRKNMIAVRKEVRIFGIKIWDEKTESNYPIDINNIKVEENGRQEFEGSKIGFKKRNHPAEG